MYSLTSLLTSSHSLTSLVTCQSTGTSSYVVGKSRNPPSPSVCFSWAGIGQNPPPIGSGYFSCGAAIGRSQSFSAQVFCALGSGRSHVIVFASSAGSRRNQNHVLRIGSSLADSHPNPQFSETFCCQPFHRVWEETDLSLNQRASVSVVGIGRCRVSPAPRRPSWAGIGRNRMSRAWPAPSRAASSPGTGRCPSRASYWRLPRATRRCRCRAASGAEEPRRRPNRKSRVASAPHCQQNHVVRNTCFVTCTPI